VSVFVIFTCRGIKLELTAASKQRRETRDANAPLCCSQGASRAFEPGVPLFSGLNPRDPPAASRKKDRREGVPKGEEERNPKTGSRRRANNNRCGFSAPAETEERSFAGKAHEKREREREGGGGREGERLDCGGKLWLFI